MIKARITVVHDKTKSGTIYFGYKPGYRLTNLQFLSFFNGGGTKKIRDLKIDKAVANQRAWSETQRNPLFEVTQCHTMHVISSSVKSETTSKITKWCKYYY